MRHYETSQLTNTFLTVPPPVSARMIKPRGAYYQVHWLRRRRGSCTSQLTHRTRGGKWPTHNSASQPFVTTAGKINKTWIPRLTFPHACMSVLAALPIFFSPPQSFTLTCKCYTLLWWGHQRLCHPDVIPSARALFMCACKWGREKGRAAAVNRNSSVATNITWKKLWLQLHNSKNTFKRQRKRFTPRRE